MPELRIDSAVVSDIKSEFAAGTELAYSVPTVTIDSAGDQKETR